MAWKTFHLGTNVNASSVGQAAAEIITEQLGNCSYASENLSYNYGGSTYRVQVKSGSSSQTATYILSVNTDTGEFFISATVPYFKQGAFYDYIASAIFSVKTDGDNAVLVPVNSFSTGYNSLFNVSGNYSTTNKTTHVTLYPAATCEGFDATVNFRPIPSLYATHLNDSITAGQTIEVDGQQFLCVANGLFAKL